eukprot:scaffold217_cov377-Prasinococcus_capsulatus_cf.AAC.19
MMSARSSKNSLGRVALRGVAVAVEGQAVLAPVVGNVTQGAERACDPHEKRCDHHGPQPSSLRGRQPQLAQLAGLQVQCARHEEA